MTTDLAKAPPEILARVKATAIEVSKIVEILPLDTDERRAQAGQLLRALETLKAEAEAERKRIKAPHLKASREVDDAFRPARLEIERVAKAIRDRLSEAARLQEEKRLAALAEVKAAAEANDLDAAQTALVSMDIASLDLMPAGVSTRFTWVIDSWDVDQVPKEYLTIDRGAVEREIRDANREGREPVIAGVVFRKDARTIVRKL